MKKLQEYGETLTKFSDEELVMLLGDVDYSRDVSGVELIALIVQERISRHARTCSDLDCGFSPFKL